MPNAKEILAIIIARGGSESIPRKNVLPLHGRPLVAWPIELAKSVARIKRVIVSTDDDEIMEIARKYGAEVPFKRPAELATDEVETLPVLRHALQFFKEKENYQPEIVCLFYPTSPFLKKERVEQALKLFETTGCNSVVSVSPDYGKFWKKEPDGYKLLYPEKRVNRQLAVPLYRENGAIYFNRYEVLMDMNKIVDESKVELLVMDPEENIDIDFPEDLRKAQSRNA